MHAEFSGEYPEVPAIYGMRAEILKRLENCLAFAQRTVEGADPAHPLWKVDLGQVSGYEKMMLEVGLLAHLVDRIGCCDEAVGRLARTIRAHYDSTPALSCILRHPRLAASLGSLLLVLERFGLATEQERVIVHRALQSPYADCSEHVPFRLLDRRWVLGLADGAAEPLTEAVRLSTACRTTHPIYMTREDAYAVTHTVMYATDFGARVAPPELRGDPVWHMIDAAVAWCAAAGDYDLLAELLLAQLLLRRRLSAYGVLAWRRSREIWDTLGFLPSPSLSAASFRTLKDENEERQYAFQNMYHTVLVGGLLCAAFFHMGVVAPDAPAGGLRYEEPPSAGRAIEGAAGYLARLLRVSPAVAREAISAVDWTASGTRMSELARSWAADDADQEAATRMATDASIILAAQDYDLSGLAAALRRAAASTCMTPTVHAGADFLARQSLIGGVIGAGWLGHDPSDADGDAMSSARTTAALANCLVGLREHLTRERADVR